MVNNILYVDVCTEEYFGVYTLKVGDRSYLIEGASTESGNVIANLNVCVNNKAYTGSFEVIVDPAKQGTYKLSQNITECTDIPDDTIYLSHTVQALATPTANISENIIYADRVNSAFFDTLVLEMGDRTIIVPGTQTDNITTATATVMLHGKRYADVPFTVKYNSKKAGKIKLQENFRETYKPVDTNNFQLSPEFTERDVITYHAPKTIQQVRPVDIITEEVQTPDVVVLTEEEKKDTQLVAAKHIIEQFEDSMVELIDQKIKNRSITLFKQYKKELERQQSSLNAVVANTSKKEYSKTKQLLEQYISQLLTKLAKSINRESATLTRKASKLEREITNKVDTFIETRANLFESAQAASFSTLATELSSTVHGTVTEQSKLLEQSREKILQDLSLYIEGVRQNTELILTNAADLFRQEASKSVKSIVKEAQKSIQDDTQLIVEKATKQSVTKEDFTALQTDIDGKIVHLKRYIEMSSGGGGGMQLAAGGTIRGDLTVYNLSSYQTHLWDSVYSTVLANSGSWNGGGGGSGSDVSGLSANWQNAYTIVDANSSNWQSTYSTVFAESASWLGGGSDVSGLSANWQNTYTIVGTNSASWNDTALTVTLSSNLWNYQGTDIKDLTGNWESTYTTVFNNSANWDYQGLDIRALSSNWESTYSTVFANSSQWAGTGSDVSTISANWQSTYTTVFSNSSTWNYQGLDIRGLSANWESTYSTVFSNSANWDYQGLDVRALTANWQNAYTTTTQQSASNASVFTTVNTNSGSWQNVYSVVNANSASWGTGGAPSIGNLTYARWGFVGSPPISAFSISGATQTDTKAYRVTIDYLLQDPDSYTVNIGSGDITFSSAPPLSSEIVVIEEISTLVSIDVLRSVGVSVVTVLSTDGIIVSNNSNPALIILPSITTSLAGKKYDIKNKGTGVATVSSLDSTIDGATSIDLLQYDSLRIVTDSVEWLII